MSNPSFRFKEVDIEGLVTLNIISGKDNFNTWIYQSIKPFLQGNILEIGSGIGNITQCVMNDKFKVTASDVRENYCNILRNRFGQDQYLNEIRNIDIVHPNFEIEYRDLFDKFDCIFSLNTIEHIENDLLALENCRKLLKRNGNIVILVPAYMKLYNNFDKELNHFKRYSKYQMENLFRTAGFDIIKSKYFNFVGIAGWWFNGSLLRKRIIPEGQMNLFNKLVPVFKIFDKMVMNKIGLSEITIGKKNDD